MLFPIVSPSGKIFKPGVNKRWTLGESTVAEMIGRDELLFDDIKGKVYRIKRPNDYAESQIPFLNIIEGEGSLKTAKDEVAKLGIPRELFDTPKPLALIAQLIKISSSKESIVLDFFAGSGTAGHAVWELNKEDGGNRQVILVTNNESNICEDVTYERLRRCNLPEHGDYQEGLEYLQLKHVAETEVDGYDMTQSFEHIKQVINVRFGSFKVIEETDDWYITDKIAVLKNYVKYPAFFERFSDHPAYGLVTKKERQSQVFRAEALNRATIDNIHVFNKEYLNDLYRVVKEEL